MITYELTYTDQDTGYSHLITCKDIRCVSVEYHKNKLNKTLRIIEIDNRGPKVIYEDLHFNDPDYVIALNILRKGYKI